MKYLFTSLILMGCATIPKPTDQIKITCEQGEVRVYNSDGSVNVHPLKSTFYIQKNTNKTVIILGNCVESYN